MPITLRRLIIKQTGQDVQGCRGCQMCNAALSQDADIPLDSLIQLILMNDEEVLTSRTVWSDQVLQNARQSCIRELDIEAVLLALRQETLERGLAPPQSGIRPS